MKATKPSNRRKFLLAASLGGAGAAAAIVAGGARSPREGEASADAPAARASGYRLTEHVRKYYKTTEV